MARAFPAPQSIATGGTVLTYTTIGADGVGVPFDGETWFNIKNDSGVAITPNITANLTVEGVALGVKSLGSFANLVEKVFRPWNKTAFKQEDGYLYVNGENLKIAIYRK